MSGRRSKDNSPTIGLLAFFAGLLLGSLTGAVAMLLLAPRKGKKTRAQLLKKGEKLRHQAAESMEDAVSEAGNKAHQVADGMQKGASDLQQGAQDMLARH